MEVEEAYRYVLSNITQKVSDRPGMLEVVKEACGGRKCSIFSSSGIWEDKCILYACFFIF
jgi:hypothetical protein